MTENFVPTRWTLVLRAQGETPEATAALGELCEAYYQPVLRFLRREGREDDAAREIAQEFFARILARGSLGDADPERGRFRSYLLGALKHFLSDRRKHERREKRGGGAALESIDAAVEEGGVGPDAAWSDGPPHDAEFDREWAMAVMARGLESVEAEWGTGGKAGQFEVLKPWLVGESPGMSQADAARQLGVTEGAIKVAVHRLRKRFRDAVRTEIGQTLRDPTLVDEELRHLIEALT